MKLILNGSKRHLKYADIKWVTVPLYDELAPINIIEKWGLKNNEDMINYCPEITYKEPVDRDFFYNVLNTILPHEVEKLVHNSMLKR